MAHQGVSGLGLEVNQHEGLLLDQASDARSVVAEAKACFDVTMAKSDALDDADVSKVASIVRDKAKVEEARLNGARVMLAHASAYLSAISVARFGASRQPSSLKPKLQEDKESNKLYFEEEAACAHGRVEGS